MCSEKLAKPNNQKKEQPKKPPTEARLKVVAEIERLDTASHAQATPGRNPSRHNPETTEFGHVCSFDGGAAK